MNEKSFQMRASKNSPAYSMSQVTEGSVGWRIIEVFLTLAV
jgi:hypothetical protein